MNKLRLDSLKRAAQKGKAEDQMALGVELFFSENDRLIGFDWILRAANQGLASAQYFVASEYANGDYVNKDLSKSFFWYKKASENGHIEAKYNAGLMLLTGEGTEKNFSMGRELVIASAQGGELLALRLLCESYSNGLFGFDIDLNEARKWCDKYNSET